MRNAILIIFSILTIHHTFAQEKPNKQQVVCEWDETLNLRNKVLFPRPFFAYTPFELQKYFKSDNYLNCEGYISGENSKFSLNLIIKIKDDKAQRQWGNINTKSTITLFSIKGKLITLKTVDGGITELENGYTIYKCNYLIPTSVLKKMRKFEVASVLINWSKGFQTFEVNYLDFFKDQICCFTLQQ